MRPRWLLFLILALIPALPLRAENRPHWAYQPVVRPALPQVNDRQWPRNAIDYFILARLEAKKLQPAPPALRHQLLRRATFDLTGLPPTLAELDAFLADDAPAAYERQIDRLLHSPRYGERMATHWLDLARYADTHGYYVDSHRDMWRYRDEVIASFNRHQPFDQFTIEQLAGDLIPGATLEQQIASGFNRNHMINFEPGALPEEYHNEYVVDRVNTTATVWLGQTLACAQCHDHKHDPYSMRDYYAFAAFFNNVPEEGLDGRRGNAVPLIKAPNRAQQQQLAELDERLATLGAALARRASEAQADQRRWEQRLAAGKDKLPEPPRDTAIYFPLDEEEGEQTVNAATAEVDPRRRAKVTGSPYWIEGKFGNGLLLDGETAIDAGDVCRFETRSPFTFAAWVFPTTADAMTILARTTTDETRRGYELYLAGQQLHVALRHKDPEDVLLVRTRDKLPTNRWRHVAVTHDGSGEAAGIKLFIDGIAQEVVVVRDRLAGGSIQCDPPLVIGRGAQESAFRGMLDEVRGYARQLSAGEIALLAGSHPVLELIGIAREKRTPEQSALLETFYLEHHDAAYQRLLGERRQFQQARREVLAASPTAMVMAELAPPRDTFVLERGDYRQPGEKVTANTPAALPPLPSDAPRNRLALARWLVDGQHPLTARVTVNRLWQLHFGQALVQTPGDFGLHGAPPTHPELLDWLANEFVRSGWNVQHIQRLILTSATYRQSAARDAAVAGPDADRRTWLAGFPRQRLPAEMLRDQALAVSGLLSETMYGRGVSPYQPPGLWEEIGLQESEFSVQSYVQSSGADLYRRSLYTFWKRTSPPPNMALFDAADRQVCAVARETTNTPLQALVLWNDPTYVEAARHLATLALRAHGDDTLHANFIFRRVLSREPSQREHEALARLLARQRFRYRRDSAAAARLLAVGDSPADTSLDAAELAAWTLVAHAVLNLDEALSRN